MMTAANEVLSVFIQHVHENRCSSIACSTYRQWLLRGSYPLKPCSRVVGAFLSNTTGPDELVSAHRAHGTTHSALLL